MLSEHIIHNAVTIGVCGMLFVAAVSNFVDLMLPSVLIKRRLVSILLFCGFPVLYLGVIWYLWAVHWKSEYSGFVLGGGAAIAFLCAQFGPCKRRP